MPSSAVAHLGTEQNHNPYTQVSPINHLRSTMADKWLLLVLLGKLVHRGMSSTLRKQQCGFTGYYHNLTVASVILRPCLLPLPPVLLPMLISDPPYYCRHVGISLLLSACTFLFSIKYAGSEQLRISQFTQDVDTLCNKVSQQTSNLDFPQHAPEEGTVPESNVF